MLIAILVAVVVLVLGYTHESNKREKEKRAIRRRKKRFCDWARKHGGKLVVDRDDCVEFEFPNGGGADMTIF